eukprot:COSAG04_NODE_9358_length_871_cov_0.674870_2_plen_111_part_01
MVVTKRKTDKGEAKDGTIKLVGHEAEVAAAAEAEAEAAEAAAEAAADAVPPMAVVTLRAPPPTRSAFSVANRVLASESTGSTRPAGAEPRALLELLRQHRPTSGEPGPAAE